MQYLVMKNRIINLAHIPMFDIYKPMGHLKDQRNQVLATDADTKELTRFSKVRLRSASGSWHPLPARSTPLTNQPSPSKPSSPRWTMRTLNP